MASRRKGTRRKHEAAAPPSLSRRGVWLRAALIVFAGAVVYANALSGPFVLDDQDTVVVNEQIRHLWPPSVVLFPALELPVAGRPAVNVSLAVNYALGGLDVRGYHIVNVAITSPARCCCSGIVGRTLRNTVCSRSGSVRDRAIWRSPLRLSGSSIHLLTDAVDYVTQRPRADAGLLLPADVLRKHSRPEEAKWRLVAVISAHVGDGFKGVDGNGPSDDRLADRTFIFNTWKETWQQRAQLYVPLAATWMVLRGVGMVEARGFRSAGFSSGMSPWTYLLNQAQMIVHYLRLVIWPRGLVVVTARRAERWRGRAMRRTRLILLARSHPGARAHAEESGSSAPGSS